MNRRWISFAALLTLCWLTGASSVLAQYGGQGSSAGTAGRTTGSQTAGSSSSVSSAQGYGLDNRYMGSGFSRFTTGSSAMGTTTAGAGAATSGAFGQSGQGAMGGAGGQNLGRGMGGMNNMGGMMGMGMMGMGRNMFGGMNNQQQTQQGTKRLRTRQRLGFAQPLASPAAINANYSTIIGRVLARGDYGKGEVTLAMEGSTAVLTGIVESPHAREVAERLALLEPGIGAVRNELTVGPVAPTPATSPTSSSAGRPR